LLEAAGEGHCALPKALLVEQAAKLLEINVAIVREALERLLPPIRQESGENFRESVSRTNLSG
jgi:hypothetical protein